MSPKTCSTLAAVSMVAAFACGPPSGPSLALETVAALDVAMFASVDAGHVPGAVALVVSRDTVLYRRSVGVMHGDGNGDVPMRPDALFRIFSMTKPLTSVGVMMLREEGLVDLDAPASSYLPELEGREVFVGVDSATGEVLTEPASRPITVRDLLRHTSGFGYPFSNETVLSILQSGGFSEREYPLVHEPGARWTYGISTLFLGSLIEQVSGLPLPEFLDSRILVPLGMADTSFDLKPEDSERLTSTFRRVEGRFRAGPRAGQYQPTIRGDYGLLSTADDYGRFLQMLLGRGVRGADRLLSEESIDEMASDQLEGLVVTEQPGVLPNLSEAFPLGAGRDVFGLGFQITVGDRPGERSSGSLSWSGLQNTHFWVDVQSGLGVILMTQVAPFYEEGVLELISAFEHALYEGAR